MLHVFSACADPGYAFFASAKSLGQQLLTFSVCAVPVLQHLLRITRVRTAPGAAASIHSLGARSPGGSIFYAFLRAQSPWDSTFDLFFPLGSIFHAVLLARNPSGAASMHVRVRRAPGASASIHLLRAQTPGAAASVHLVLAPGATASMHFWRAGSPLWHQLLLGTCVKTSHFVFEDVCACLAVIHHSRFFDAFFMRGCGGIPSSKRRGVAPCALFEF